MEKEHQDDVHEDVVSQEDSQPTESNQHTFTATCPPPPDITTCSAYDYNILSNIKCEHILPDNMREDSAGTQRGPSVDDRVVTGLQSVKSEGQRPELVEQQTIHPIMDTDLVLMKACNVKGLTEMKSDKNADPDEYSRTSNETRHWVVCPGGVLKEVKAEHTYGVSEIVSDEDFSENDAKMERESQLSVRERKHTDVEHFIGDTSGKASIHPNDLKCCERPQPIAKPFTCDACGKSFSRRYNLREHERIHSGFKPLICDKCGKSFSSPSNLKRHEIRHSGVRPFTCDTCGKSFTHACELEMHNRIHTGVKPFTCAKCGKSFARSSRLREHERMHTGVKPFTCDACGKSFTHSSSLREHERRHLGVKHFTL